MHKRKDGPIVTRTFLERETHDAGLTGEPVENERPFAVRTFGKTTDQYGPAKDIPQFNRAGSLPARDGSRILPRIEVASKDARLFPDDTGGEIGKKTSRVHDPLTPSMSPRRNLDACDALREEQRTSAPTVKVTIGRIDVPAIMPPPGPPKTVTKRRTGPMLTLDEYLKNRSGGR